MYPSSQSFNAHLLNNEELPVLTVSSSRAPADGGGRLKPQAHPEAGQPCGGDIQLHPLCHQQQLGQEL